MFLNISIKFINPLKLLLSNHSKPIPTKLAIIPNYTIIMIRRTFNYLTSRKFKTRAYAATTLSLVGYTIYLAFTINKPFIKPTRA